MIQQYKIGIRRQNKDFWQRRCPLSPVHVKELIESYPQIKVLVQPSNVRIFCDREFQMPGVSVQQDLSQCQLILGIKEIPQQYHQQGKSYMTFSHVIKGQIHNLSILNSFIQKKIRLFDYQCIKNGKGQRLLAFGKFAGIAGAIDFLQGLGWILLKKGFSTQFLKITYSYTYQSISEAKEKITRTGIKIRQKGLAKQFLPLVFVVTGSGRTASGVIQILMLLQPKIVKIQQLPHLQRDAKCIYLCLVQTKDVMVDGQGKFNREEFRKNPQKYTNRFQELVLPYTSCLFHCIYWQPRYPKYVSNKALKNLALENKLRLLGICDITCDINGSLQPLKKFTTPDNPFFMFDPIEQQQVSMQVKQNRFIYLAVDFLPCQLAYDSSMHFSNILKDYIPLIMKSNQQQKQADKMNLPDYLANAVITVGGELTQNFKYLSKYLK